MSPGPPTTPRVQNKKVRYNFDLIDSIEAGIALTGSEVKSLRDGRASLDEAYATIRENEVFLVGCTIQPYPMASHYQHAPKRERKLLLHRRQIAKWLAKVTQRGFTLVPVAMYFNEKGIVKVEIALAKGKTHGDRREDLKEREHKREMDRESRRRR